MNYNKLDLKKIVKNDLCISCGACKAINENLNFVERKGMFVPNLDNSKDNNYEKEFDVCPGKGYKIIELGKNLFPSSEYKTELGYYLEFFAAYYTDKQFLKNSSSGAVMTGIANYCLTNNIIDGVVVTRFEYTKNGPIPKPFIATNTEEILSSQGSKYMPVPLLEIIPEIINFDGRLAIIGTPCQIAGFNLLKSQIEELNKVQFTIGNFCGGFRDFRESNRIFKIFGLKKNKISFFRFRGGGQPGSMLIRDDNKEVKLKYPDYSRLTGYTKHKRCRLCVDATAELADISCGDAWIPQFLNSEKNWSVIISRSKTGKEIVDKMKTDQMIVQKEISLEELLDSQKDNIRSKKIRQNSRFSLYELLKLKIPSFDGGYYKNDLNIIKEFKIIVQYRIMYLLEILKMYLPFAKFMGRIKNEEL